MSSSGSIYGLCGDGWIRQIHADRTAEDWAYTGGRPLGAAFDSVCARSLMCVCARVGTSECTRFLCVRVRVCVHQFVRYFLYFGARCHGWVQAC